MRRIRGLRLTYANVMSTIAVMLALGATSYAAFNLPNNSVTSKKIKDGAVLASDLANGAVTCKKLTGNAVTTSKIANAAVTGTKLAAATVTGTNLAPASVTESNVVPGSLTGAAFQCAAGDEGLDNRHECFFALTPAARRGPKRSRGAAPAARRRRRSPRRPRSRRPPRGAEARLATGTFWTSQIAVGASPFTNSTAYAAEVDSGSIVALIPVLVNSSTIIVPSIACVCHAADESLEAVTDHRRAGALLACAPMATAPSEPLSQRLAAIRDQLKLLADYL